MNYIEHFTTISFGTLNLFSFMLGLFYSLCNYTWGNPRKLWLQVVLYIVFVAFYYFIKSEGYL